MSQTVSVSQNDAPQQTPEQVTAGVEQTRGGPTYQPRVDIVERADELVLTADMPGLKGDNIDVQFEDRQLTIHGHIEPRQSGECRYLLREYGVGDFFRTFKVSEQIDGSRISAEYRNGVLTLHLPKAEAAKPRRIAVGQA
ncbi:MAG: Hsp20/alpha crystallin family protein [Pirellulales bacterium]